jgi:hypothetical protein
MFITCHLAAMTKLADNRPSNGVSTHASLTWSVYAASCLQDSFFPSSHAVDCAYPVFSLLCSLLTVRA